MTYIRIRAPVGGLLRTVLWAASGMVCFTSAPALAESGQAVGPTMCACPGAHKPLGNNATCEDACYGSSSDSGSGDYSGAEEAGRQARRWVDCKLFGKGCPDQSDGRRDAGRNFNELGVQAYNKGDWATAISLFQQALQNSPDDPVIRKNLANAQANLAEQQARERAEKEAIERQRQNKVAVDNMQQSIQNFAQTLTAAPVSGGLDFDLRDAPNSPSKAGSGSLDFTASVAAPSRPSVSSDPKVADAQVPRDGAYLTDQVPELKNSPAADRIAKGFQAVINHDWPAALAWWQDALNRDPNNAALKRSVELAQWMVDKRKAKAAGPATPLGAAIHSASRGDYVGAIRQFELVKAENPAIAAQVDDMIQVLRRRQDANDTKLKTFRAEFEKSNQRIVDAIFERGIDYLVVGDSENAKRAFDDAADFGRNYKVHPKLPAPKSEPVFKTLPDGRVVLLPSDSDAEHLFPSLDPYPPAPKSGKPPESAPVSKTLPDGRDIQLPSDSDMYLQFGPDPAPTVFKTLPDGRVLQMPSDSDMELLYLGPDPDAQLPAPKSGKTK